MVSIKQLFEWFTTGKFPNEDQFQEQFKSFWHKSERLPQTQVLGLNSELKRLDDTKASKDDLSSAIGGLIPMGSVENLEELATKPKRPNDSYYVNDQKDENGNPYIYRYDEGLDEWINTKQVVYKNVATRDEILIKDSPFDIAGLTDKSKALIDIFKQITIKGYDVSKRYRLYAFSYHAGSVPTGIAFAIADSELPENATEGFDVFNIANFDISETGGGISIKKGGKILTVNIDILKIAGEMTLPFVKNAEGLLKESCFDEYAFQSEKQMFASKPVETITPINKGFINIKPAYKDTNFKEVINDAGDLVLSWDKQLLLKYDNGKYKFLPSSSIVIPADFSKLSFAYIDVNVSTNEISDIQVAQWLTAGVRSNWFNPELNIFRYIVAMRGYSGFIEWDNIGYLESKAKGEMYTDDTFSEIVTNASINNVPSRIFVDANAGKTANIDGKIQDVSIGVVGDGIIKFVHFRETAGVYSVINIVNLPAKSGTNLYSADRFESIEVKKGDVFGIANDVDNGEGVASSGVCYVGGIEGRSFIGGYLINNQFTFSKSALNPATPSKVQMSYTVNIRATVKQQVKQLENKIGLVGSDSSKPTSVLYNSTLKTSDEWTNPNGSGFFDENGLKITGLGLENVLLLNRQYNLNKKVARYRVKFGADSRMMFMAKEIDRFVSMGTITEVDVAAKKLRIYHAFNAQTNVLPAEKANVDIPFDIVSDQFYIVEFVRDNKENRLTLINTTTSQRINLSDVSGATGRQYDFYGLCLYSGSPVYLTEMKVSSGLSRPEIIIYGDSITDGMYLPDPDKRYAQLIVNKFDGNGMISGRGGGAIGDLTRRIKNELPFLMPKYCMIAIGTNGGNSVDNLSILIEYILSLGIVPILNNIPCAGDGRQVARNAMIQQVRDKYQIEGCLMDLPTSLNNDGLEINYGIYNSDGGAWVHPNEIGHYEMASMF